MIAVVEIFVAAVSLYSALGLLFAVLFVTRGAQRIDRAAEDAGWGFRLLLIPGSVALWPLLLQRWLAGGAAPIETTAHRRAATPEGRR